MLDFGDFWSILGLNLVDFWVGFVCLFSLSATHFHFHFHVFADYRHDLWLAWAGFGWLGLTLAGVDLLWLALAVFGWLRLALACFGWL